MSILRKSNSSKRLPVAGSAFPLSVLQSMGASANTPEKVQTTAAGVAKGKKSMARPVLTLKQQLKGVKAALKSPKTPRQFREGLTRRRRELEKKLGY